MKSTPSQGTKLWRPSGKHYIDWDLEDPKGQGVESVRATRIEIEQHVESLLADLDAA